jgi:predicted molibdopterin-dependent oxidoreductase YjgC
MSLVHKIDYVRVMHIMHMNAEQRCIRGGDRVKLAGRVGETTLRILNAEHVVTGVIFTMEPE